MQSAPKPSSSNRDIRILTLPVIAPQIKLEDLQEDLRLLTSTQIETIKSTISRLEKKHLARHPDTTLSACYSKKTFDGNIPYSIRVHKESESLFANYNKPNNGIGAGAFGRVKVSQNLSTGDCMAYKVQVVNQSAGLCSMKESTCRRNIEKEYQHTKAMFITTIAPHHKISYKKEEHQYNYGIPYVPGYTLDRIGHVKRFQHNNDILYLIIIIAALEAIHEMHTKHRVIHRDIKRENIIFNPANNKATIIDHGFTRSLPPNSDSFYGPSCGTPLMFDYQARQLYKDYGGNIPDAIIPYSMGTDNFAAAITIAMMLELYHEPLELSQYDTEKSHITDKDSELFNNNQLIGNPVLRGEILGHLHKMTDYITDTRPSPSASISFFKGLKAKYQASKKTILIILVDDFISKTSFEHFLCFLLIKMLAADKNIWKICLADTAEKNDKRIYLMIKRLFEEQKLPVNNYILICGAPGTITAQSIRVIVEHEKLTDTGINISYLPGNIYDTIISASLRNYYKTNTCDTSIRANINCSP